MVMGSEVAGQPLAGVAVTVYVPPALTLMVWPLMPLLHRYVAPAPAELEVRVMLELVQTVVPLGALITGLKNVSVTSSTLNRVEPVEGVMFVNRMRRFAAFGI